MRRQLLAGVVGLAAAAAAGCTDDVPTGSGSPVRGPNLARLGDDGGMEAGGVASIIAFFSLNTEWVPISWSADLSGATEGCTATGHCQAGGLVSSISPQLDATVTATVGPRQGTRFAFMTTADLTYTVAGGAPQSFEQYRSSIESDGQYRNNGSGQRERIPGQESYVIPANTPAEVVFDYAFMTAQTGPGTENHNPFAVVSLTLNGAAAGSFVISRNDLQPGGTGATTDRQLVGGCGTQRLETSFAAENQHDVQIAPQDVSYPLCTGWRRDRIAIQPAAFPRTAVLTAYVSEAENGSGGYLNNANATTFALDNLSFESIEDGGGDPGGGNGGTNTAPTVAIDAAIGAEGAAIRLHSTASDAEGAIASFAWGVPAGCSIESTTLTSAVLSCVENGTYAVTLRVTDAGGLSTVATRDVVVKNAAPVVNGFGVADIFRAGTPLLAAAAFTDRGVLDTHAASFNINSAAGSRTIAGTVAGNQATADFGPLPAAGFYDLRVTITDDDGGKGSGIKPNIIVYDRNAGYIRANGTIPSGTGVASFAFALEYASDADETPSGSVRFVLPNGSVFSATTFRYLVIEGANVFAEGCGTLNGTPGTCFWFQATDAGATGDRLHFKLNRNTSSSNVIFYDQNRLVNAGGSVEILKY
jgi:hypothetical protein